MHNKTNKSYYYLKSFFFFISTKKIIVVVVKLSKIFSPLLVHLLQSFLFCFVLLFHCYSIKFQISCHNFLNDKKPCVSFGPWYKTEISECAGSAKKSISVQPLTFPAGCDGFLTHPLDNMTWCLRFCFRALIMMEKRERKREMKVYIHVERNEMRKRKCFYIIF